LIPGLIGAAIAYKLLTPPKREEVVWEHLGDMNTPALVLTRARGKRNRPIYRLTLITDGHPEVVAIDDTLTAAVASAQKWVRWLVSGEATQRLEPPTQRFETQASWSEVIQVPTTPAESPTERDWR